MMTDNEIIKALECCADEMGCKKGCPYFNPKAKGSCCTISKIGIEKTALDLINRQKAEIERLCVELDEVIIAKDLLFDEAEALIKKAKADAVKEFEERAIKNICEKVYAPTPVQSCIVEKCNQVIIETAKEMAGEEK